MSRAKRTQAEYGDFQTPLWLAQQVCTLLANQGLKPAAILEPTCGVGHFLEAALNQFQFAKTVVATDINPDYVAQTKARLLSFNSVDQQIFQADFFGTDWPTIIENLPQPLLILGNPPWVTNAALSTLNSDNVPSKEGRPLKDGGVANGLLSITGGGNFDLSEWIIEKLITWSGQGNVTVAMLCKTAVARKLLHHLWQKEPVVGPSQIYLIDAKSAFDVMVDACLFVYQTRPRLPEKSCPIFADWFQKRPLTQIGFDNGHLLANIGYYQRWQQLEQDPNRPIHYKWRSGIKHDCARVMELTRYKDRYTNQLGDVYELESTYMYPLLKSSDVARLEVANGAEGKNGRNRWLLVPQQRVGAPTHPLKQNAPKTWAYLQQYGALLDRRKSRIYKNRPRFSIFGVGSYSFAPWKVAISGLYKSLHFAAVGPTAGKPTVLDDTCYFLPCTNQTEAELLVELLSSDVASQFYQSFIFWDAKRPITAKILQRLNIMTLADELGRLDDLLACTDNNWQRQPAQLSLL